MFKNSDAMEKLVEELARHLSYCFNESGGLVRDTETARNLIARIGKAYADGELELPGEVDRWGKGSEANIEQWVRDMLMPSGAMFIALRPLSGTGKEEE